MSVYRYDDYKTGAEKSFIRCDNDSTNKSAEETKFLLVDTKYFTAQVGLTTLHLSHSTNIAENLTSQSTEACEGVVLVCSTPQSDKEAEVSLEIIYHMSTTSSHHLLLLAIECCRRVC